MVIVILSGYKTQVNIGLYYIIGLDFLQIFYVFSFRVIVKMVLIESTISYNIRRMNMYNQKYMMALLLIVFLVDFECTCNSYSENVKFKIFDEATLETLKIRELNVCKFVYFKLKPGAESPYLDEDADWYITSVVTDVNGIFELDLSSIKETHIVIEPGKPYDITRFSRTSDFAGTKSVDHIRVSYFHNGLTKRIYDLKNRSVKIITSSGETVEEPFTEILLAVRKHQSGLNNEAKSVMVQFQQALKDSDWNKGLDFCSQNVKSNVEDYNSTEAFFREVVPMDDIVSLSQFQTYGGKYNRDGQQIEFFCSLRIPTVVSEKRVDWVWKVIKNGDKWLIDFQSLPLEKWIEKETNRLARETEVARKKREELRKGFAIKLAALNEEFVVGQPMLFRIEMTNISSSSIEFMSTSSAMANDPMVVVGPNGEIEKYIDTDYQTLGREEKIETGESIILAEKYDVTSQYRIIRPGQYTFQFNGFERHGLRPSNIVKMEVKPGGLLPEDIIFEKLLSVLPEGWKLTKTRACNNADLDMARGICLSLLGKLGDKGTSQGTIAIFMWINPEKFNLDAIEFDGEFLGQSEWGPVYIKSVDADLLWPNYKEKMIEALNIEEDKSD
jgi:hypothetical protein